MKILQLCLRSPFPPADGGTIAMYNMAMALNKSGVAVKILAFNTKKHFVDPSTLPEQFVATFQPELVYLDATVKFVPALVNLVAGGSYNVNRFHTRLFNDTLEQILDRDEFDVIQMESLFMTPYLDTIRKKSKALVVLRSHNVEYLIWQRLAVSEKNTLKKWYLELLSKRLKKYETEIVNKLDGIIALTGEDKMLYEKMGCKIPVLVAPIGLDVENYPFRKEAEIPSSIVHLGSMDWLPNIEGVDWFLENVYPSLIAESNTIQVNLAGKNMPQRIFDLESNHLHIMGRIDDAKNYLLDKRIMIVPLLSGGGMRVKIIEGMAMGKTIVSTSIGAEGINYTDGKNILIADSPEDFKNAILNCIRNPALSMTIGQAARLLAASTYDNKVIGSALMKFYTSISANKTNTVSSLQV